MCLFSQRWHAPLLISYTYCTVQVWFLSFCTELYRTVSYSICSAILPSFSHIFFSHYLLPVSTYFQIAFSLSYRCMRWWQYVCDYFSADVDDDGSSFHNSVHAAPPPLPALTLIHLPPLIIAAHHSFYIFCSSLTTLLPKMAEHSLEARGGA